MAVDTLRSMTFLLMSFVAPAMAGATDARPAGSAAPCRTPRQVLHIEPRLEPTIERLWHHSPTFHRQVARLAASGLVVTIEWCRTKTECPGTVRALTTVKFRNGVLAHANVRIQFRPMDVPELIAHELEHVIEHLDGVDLTRLENSGTHVVRVDEQGHYETARAQHMGRLAAAEYRAGVGVASACERTTP